MSFFDFFRHQPIEPLPPVTLTPKPKVTYGIMFKHYINYINEQDKVAQWFWTSDIFRDYNRALAASKRFVLDVTEIVNNPDGDFIRIIDACLAIDKFINASALDPALVVFENGVAKRVHDIAVSIDGNLIIKQTDGDDILEGDFKIMKQGIDW